jgi:acetyl-CoA carboxylase biotin carboxylase subunit
MKAVRDPEALARGLPAAQAEAQAAFGSGDLYLERYVTRPRHIEVQVIADSHGQAAHLYERECSIQRRNQKLVEEAPSPALASLPDVRAWLLRESVEAVRRIGYQSVGTIEFLMDPERGELYFMEMNTRLQVEHTVTEMVTGIDLVREQIRIAAGEPLGFAQADVRVRGWAIEVRVNAEDPVSFAPSPGRITALHVPGGPGVRLDTHIYAHYVVPPHYDSLLAKLIAFDQDREAAVRRLRRALHEFVVEGIRTNLDLHREVVEHPDFIAGRLDTAFLERLRGPA